MNRDEDMDDSYRWRLRRAEVVDMLAGTCPCAPGVCPALRRSAQGAVRVRIEPSLAPAAELFLAHDENVGVDCDMLDSLDVVQQGGKGAKREVAIVHEVLRNACPGESIRWGGD